MKYTKDLVEGRHGHGAVKSNIDIRDRKWSKLARAPQPFDWNTGYDKTIIVPTKDQGTSSSCGGQSGSYLEANLSILQGKSIDEKSAKYIYSQVWYKGGGTTMRDVFNLLTKKGVCSETILVSYQQGQPPTEGYMEDKSGLTVAMDTNAATSKGLSYAFVNPDIESVAQAARDNGGAIIRLDGQNNGTWLSPVPIAPSNNNLLWSHFLCVVGAGYILVNRVNKKALKCHNSWGADTGTNGYQWITEDYFNSGHIKEAGVVYQPSNPVITNPPQSQNNIWKTVIAMLQAIISYIQSVSATFAGTRKP